MCQRNQHRTTRGLLGTPGSVCKGYGMFLVIVWVLAVMALLALMIAWGATIDDASDTYARAHRAWSAAPRRMASRASR
jgi:uncharacterized membrane protein